MSVSSVVVQKPDEYIAARDALLTELHKVTIPKIPRSHVAKDGTVIGQRDRLIGTIGRTTNYGWGRTRAGYKDYVNNKKHPELFAALVRFGNLAVPSGWTYQSITLNHGVQAKKHIDIQNNGDSVIVGIGNYIGGELNVYDISGIEFVSHDIHDKPLMFNGAIYPHETKPFEGERYTMIFFKQKRTGTVEGFEMRGV